MKALCIVLALLIVAGAVFATYCTSSGDCADDEYCDSYGTCQPYFSSTTTTSGCCGPAALMLFVGALAFYYSNVKKA